METRKARSIPTKVAAKMVRTLLKTRFPSVKFSVRFERYSMGSHINISWDDGPAKCAVEALVVAFSGKRYDGMSESTYYETSWLLPDGSAVVALDEAGRMIAQPCPDAELVQFGGSEPHCSRRHTIRFLNACWKRWQSMSAEQQTEFRQRHVIANGMSEVEQFTNRMNESDLATPVEPVDEKFEALARHMAQELDCSVERAKQAIRNLKRLGLIERASKTL